MNLLQKLKGKVPLKLLFPVLMVLFALISLFSVFQFSQSQKIFPLFIPLLLLFFPLFFIYPQIIPFLLFASFYWGYVIWGQKFLFVSWYQIVFIVAVLGVLSKYLLKKNRPDHPFSHNVLIILLLFFAAAVVSFFLNAFHHSGDEIFVSLTYLLNLSALPVAFILFSSNTMKVKKNSIVLFILFLSILEIPVVVYQVVALGANYSTHYRDVTGTFGAHHSMLANMMTFPLGFSVFKLLQKPSLKQKIIFAAIAIASLYAIIYSASRSNLVGISGAILIMVILKLRLKPIHFIYLVVLSIVGFLLITYSPIQTLVAETFKSRDTGSLDLSSLWRFFIWKFYWLYYWNSDILCKLFGVGMANSMTISLPLFFGETKIVGGAHNLFLHVLLETGVVGFVCFMTYFITILVKLYRQGRSDHLALAYFFITLSLLISGITQETFWFQPVFGCLWLYHTCLLALILDNKKPGDIVTGIR